MQLMYIHAAQVSTLYAYQQILHVYHAIATYSIQRGAMPAELKLVEYDI
jgi:hypothetical protein